jgi:DNA-binding YbaB/EbfC family protein
LFKGLGNLANLGSVLKQAQQMSSTLQGVREQLRAKRVTGVGGGGLVKVEANGLGEVLSVAIDPSLVEKGDREMIEDLLPAAFNQATAKVKQLHADAVRAATQDMGLPDLGGVLEKLTGSGGGETGPPVQP